MKKFSIGYLFNIIVSAIISFSFFVTIKLDNNSRLPENVNTDYYMNSLPYIYIILICLFILIIFNLYKFVISIRKNN